MATAKDNETDLYPIAVLIDELKHEDKNVRLNAMKNIKTIAIALGQERTRSELIPFLNDSVDDDDEVLLVMAENLGEFSALVGGDNFTYFLLNPLESLSTMEDPSVRNKAVESLCTIGTTMQPGHHQEHFVPTLRRLATNDWFTSRIAAASLFSTAYPKVDAPSKAEYIGLFSALCRDDTPMVRRAAASALAGLAAVCEPSVVREHLVPLFVGLSSDAQDSVKLLAVQNCIAISKRFGNEDKETLVLPVVMNLASDNSYRVRWSVARHMAVLGEVFGTDVTTNKLLPIMQKLLQDPEPETRSIAAGSCEGFAKLIAVGTIVSEILPSIQALVDDDESHVRVSLAGSIMSMSLLLKRDLTIQHLLPIFLKLLKDTDSEVRLKIISKLSGINEVVGVTLLSQSLLPAIVELAEDAKWRVRLAIINHIPLLAKQLGVEFFDEKLAALCMTWLGDKIHNIREAAVINLAELAKTFGPQWAAEQVLPKIVALYGHSHFLYRLTSVASLHALTAQVDQNVFETVILPTALKSAEDPVPNIRIRVATVLGIIGQKCANKSQCESTVKPVLTRMMQDSDRDVKYFAEKSIGTLDTYFASKV